MEALKRIFNETTQQELRWYIHDEFAQQRRPTIESLLKTKEQWQSGDDEGRAVSITTLHRALKGMGFRFKKLTTRAHMFISPALASLRNSYLKRMKEVRERTGDDKAYIAFVDETWLYPGMRHAYGWVDSFADNQPFIAMNQGLTAASCAPCKTFFRRAVVNKQYFSCCQRRGICAREPSLKPCRKCRYDRCINGGMKPELVAFTENSELASLISTNDVTPSPSSTSDSRRSNDSHDKKCVENESNRANEPDEDAPCDPAPSSSSPQASTIETGNKKQDAQIVANPFRIESKMEAMMQNLATLEAAHQKLRISTYTPPLTATLAIDDFAFSPSKLGDHFEEMYSPVFDPFSEMLFPTELLIKMRVVLDLSVFDWSNRKLWVVQDTIYTIEYIKAMTIYKLLDDSSKIVLASSALLCTNLCNAYYSYTQNSDRTMYPDGSVVTWSAEMLNEAPGSTRFHTGTIAALKAAEVDVREFSLLKNILICNPLLDGLQPYDSILLQHEKERYTKTLLSYVLARSGVDEGPARFARILSIIDVATKLTSWQKGVFITSFALGLAKPVTPFGDSVFHSS